MASARRLRSSLHDARMLVVLAMFGVTGEFKKCLSGSSLTVMGALRHGFALNYTFSRHETCIYMPTLPQASKIFLQSVAAFDNGSQIFKPLDDDDRFTLASLPPAVGLFTDEELFF